MDEKKPVETPAQNGTEPQSPPQSTPAMPVPPVDPTPPTPSDVPPASGSEPVPPKIQQHLDAVPHANVPIEPHHTKRFWMIVLIAVIVVLAALAGILGYFLLGNKSAAKKQDASVAAVPTNAPIATPLPDPTANWDTYSNENLSFSLKYPKDKYTVSEVPSANIQTALKPTTLIWVAQGQGDVIPLEIYYYKTSLSAENWWNTRGKVLFNQLQEEFREAQQPKPSPYPTPSFMQSETTFGGQKAIKLEGNVIAAQGFGDVTLTLVKFKDGVYMVKQRAEDKKDSDLLLSTFSFTELTPSTSTEASSSATP